MELFVYKTFKCKKVINVKFFSRDLPVNNLMEMSEIIIFIKRNVLDRQSIKKIDTFEIFNS